MWKLLLLYKQSIFTLAIIPLTLYRSKLIDKITFKFQHAANFFKMKCYVNKIFVDFIAYFFNVFIFLSFYKTHCEIKFKKKKFACSAHVSIFEDEQ